MMKGGMMKGDVDLIVSKLPPPGKMKPGGGDDEAAEGEYSDDDAAMSAYEEFARLAGFKASPETFEALKDLVTLIMMPEHRRLHPDEFAKE